MAFLGNGHINRSIGSTVREVREVVDLFYLTLTWPNPSGEVTCWNHDLEYVQRTENQ